MNTFDTKFPLLAGVEEESEVPPPDPRRALLTKGVDMPPNVSDQYLQSAVGFLEQQVREQVANAAEVRPASHVEGESTQEDGAKDVQRHNELHA